MSPYSERYSWTITLLSVACRLLSATCNNVTDEDQPTHPPSLISTTVIHFLECTTAFLASLEFRNSS